MVIDVQQGNANQHEHAAQKRINDELQRGIMTFSSSPPQLDQKVAGNQHQLPEHEEQDQIQRYKDAHGRRFERQQTHHVQLDLMSDRIPGVDHDQDGQKCREANEQYTDPIDRQVITDA